MASDLLFDLALLVVGIGREPAGRSAEAAVDLIPGLFIATEREVGVADGAAELDQSYSSWTRTGSRPPSSQRPALRGPPRR